MNIKSVAGVIVPSTLDRILVGDRSSKEPFLGGTPMRFISERVEIKDADLIATLRRGLLTEAGVQLENSNPIYLGTTCFKRGTDLVMQYCYGAVAVKYPTPFLDNEEMVNLRFEPLNYLFSVLDLTDPYEAVMRDWINRARKVLHLI